MIEHLAVQDQKIIENNIEDILVRAVNLFKKTGLSELANKWERILNSYHSKKSLFKTSN
jgi:hypothetical protein